MTKREPKRKRRTGCPRPRAAKAAGKSSGTFTLRFALEGAPPQAVHDDPRIEALRRQLAALLDLVVLTKDGQYVEVDGFKLVGDLPKSVGTVYRVFPAS